MQKTHETSRSLFMALLMLFIHPFGEYLVKAKKTHPAGSPRLPAHKKAHKKCTVLERQCESLWIYDLTANKATKTKARQLNYGKRIYYFAGGGWQSPPSSEHWNLCAELVRRLPDTTVSVVSYPLAPESAAPVAFPALLKWFRTAMRDASDSGEEITFMGDSSGGNIVLCLAIAGLQEWEGKSCPLKRLVVLCPTADLSHENPEEKRLEKNDPLHSVAIVKETGRKWVGEWDKKDPRVSPLYADVAVLKKWDIGVYGVTAGYDILSVDGLLFRDRLEKAEVRGAWLHWDKQMHCFPFVFYVRLPEATQALTWMVDRIEEAYKE